MIEFFRFKSPIGLLSILAVKEGVVKISFENESQLTLEKWCRNHLNMGMRKGTDFTTEARNQILYYLNSENKLLDFHVIHFNSPFRKEVLEVQRKIPYGKTCTYEEVAKMAGYPRAARAVGSANANNPLPLYYPCHRIICSDGSLGGFGWGLEVKQWLLNLEARQD